MISRSKHWQILCHPGRFFLCCRACTKVGIHRLLVKSAAATRQRAEPSPGEPMIRWYHMIPGSSRILQKFQNEIAKTRPDLPRAISSWLCSNTSQLKIWSRPLGSAAPICGKIGFPKRVDPGLMAWWPDGECRARSEVFSQKLRTKQLQIHGFPGSRHWNPSMYQSCHHSLMKIWKIVK